MKNPIQNITEANDIYDKHKTFKFSVVKTIPILFSYVFISIAFGILMEQAGYNFIWAYFVSATVYTGAFQFVLVSFLSGGASLITVGLTAIFMNSRHMFYGLSFTDTFKRMGKLYPYMILTLTDETYSLYCSIEYPKEVDKEKAMFYIAILSRCYWIFGTLVGSMIGQSISFDFTGIDFCLTALFVTIFIDQWKSLKSHLPAIIGILSGILFLLLLGPNKFILPTLIFSVGILILFKNSIEKVQEIEI